MQISEGTRRQKRFRTAALDFSSTLRTDVRSQVCADRDVEFFDDVSDLQVFPLTYHAGSDSKTTVMCRSYMPSAALYRTKSHQL